MEYKPLPEWLQKRLPELKQTALAARENAYAPYSRFMVGAALLAESGKIYPGCNLENGAFSPSLCGERTALAAAWMAGERHFSLLAIVGGPQDQPAETWEFCYPCGVCRQTYAEFCPPDFPLLIMAGNRETKILRLEELLPWAFAFSGGK